MNIIIKKQPHGDLFIHSVGYTATMLFLRKSDKKQVFFFAPHGLYKHSVPRLGMEKPMKCNLCRIRDCYVDQKLHTWGICERCKDRIDGEWVL